jgi:Putative adhesin
MTSPVLTTPPPPAPAPPPLTPGGRTTVRVLIIAAAAVLVIGAVTSLGVAAFGLSALRLTNDTQPLPAAMRSLTLDATGSPALIRIVADRDATEPRVDLRQIDSKRSGDAALDVTNDGTGTRVSFASQSGSFMDWHRGGELTVTLPPELARRLSVTVEQEDGALMAEADLDQLVVRSSDGAVLLSGAARRIEITSQDGAVKTRDPISVSESFKATANDGDVSVDFKDAAPRTIDVAAQDGNVSIALPPRGPYLVDANNDDDNGTTVVRVPQTMDRASAAAVITARANDGDVSITTLGR